MKFINGQLSLDSSITGTTALFTSGLTVGSAQISSGMTRGVLFNNTLTATSGSDILVGHDINPTFLGNTSANWHTLRLWQPLNQYGDNRPYMSWKYGTEYDVFRMFMDSNWKVNFKSTGQSLGFVFTGGNILINTTTDAGYRLDVNGTARVNGILTVGSDVQGKISANNAYLNLYHQGGSLSTISLGFTSGAGGYLLINQNGGDSAGTTSGTVHRYDFNSSITNSSGNAEWNFQSLRPTYNFTGTYSGIVRGFYYSPTLTSLTGVTHRAIETVTGDVILGSTSGNVGIGTSTLGTSTELTVGGGQAASSAIARGQLLNTTLTATSNNDVLVGLDVAPTFTNGAFTGVTNLALRVAYSSSRFISFTQRPGYADYGRIQFTNVTGADIYSSSRIDLLPNDTSQSVGLGNNITSQRLASSTNWGLYGPTAPGFLVGANAAFGVLSNNSDGNTDSFVFAGPTGSRHFFKVVQNDVPYFTIVPTGNVLINTTTDLGFKLSVSGSTLLRGSGTTSASYALATQNSSGGTTMVVNDAGNVLIGTTTDNGYKIRLNSSGGGIYFNTPNDGYSSSFIYATNGDGYFSLSLSGDQPRITAARVQFESNIILNANKTFAFGSGAGVNTYNSRPILRFAEISDVSGYTRRAVMFVGDSAPTTISSSLLGFTKQFITTFGVTQTTEYTGSNRTGFVGSYFAQNLVANTSDNVLVGVLINPTFTDTSGNTAAQIALGINNNVGYGIYQNGDLASNLLRGKVLIGTTNDFGQKLQVSGTSFFNGVIPFSANNQTLVMVDIQPNFNRASYTGTTALALRVSGGTQIIGSGSTGTTLSVFSVDGSSGRLFDVSDDLSSTLFSVNTIAGLPVIEAFANSSVVLGKYGQNTLVVSGTSVGIGTPSPQAKLDVNGTSIFRTGVTMNSSLTLGNVDITSSWSAYTPTWTTDGGTQPALNNGTLTGFFKLIGKICFVRVKLNPGSTTTFGSGAFQFSLPFSASSPDGIQFPCSILNNGFAWYQATVNGTYSGDVNKSAIIALSSGGVNSSEAVTATHPITFGVSDSLQFNGSYEIA